MGFVFTISVVRIEMNSFWACLKEPGFIHKVISLTRNEVVTWTVNTDTEEHGRSWYGSTQDFVKQFRPIPK
jgi:hypothetical protein